MSPIFEVFSTQIYSQAILSNLTFGGARYIATGRGFTTSRTHFSILYSRFAGPSIYMGMRTLIMLLYATITLWIPHLIYFWAVRLQEKMDELFYDDTEGGAGGYFASAPDEHVLIRMKDAQVCVSCLSPIYRKALFSSDHLLS